MTLRIVADRFVQEQPHSELTLKHIQAKAWAPKITPRFIVIHYGVTHSLDALIAAQKARGFWAHLTSDGFHNGERSVMQLTQALSFTQKGSHAGPSSYNGVEGLNDCSIGWEIANPGPLVLHEDGKLRTTYNKVWPDNDAIETGPIPGYPKNWTHWAKYTDEEVAMCAAGCHALVNHYPTIEAIVGHSEISPGRKFDPGPAFPMEWLRKFVWPEVE